MPFYFGNHIDSGFLSQWAVKNIKLRLITKRHFPSNQLCQPSE
ncbi:hypothetical protein yrohd0001_3660 [Yersinia rohdei ATCC 43380]|nr:hypothetical protein yrohd0001_3660 [Yersinia rohdei ATCC 43380]